MNNLEDYKTVLIVGNGFDLSLKYPTSYLDFMESQYFTNLVSKNNNCLARYLNYKRKKNGNWIDVEKELSAYADILKSEPSIQLRMPKELIHCKKAANILQSFREEFIQLCTALKEYLNEIENAEQFNEGYNKSHAYELVEGIIHEQKSCYVVSFNYTSFIEKVIIKINYNSTDFIIKQIHGSLKDNIVFGVQDSMELQREHVFLYKSYNKCQDVRELPQILDNADKIIFFGYSLGETDHSYFDDFFYSQTIKSCQKKKFVFYHYGQTAYDDIIWQLRTLTKNRTSYLNQYNDIEFVDNSKSLK